MGRLEKNLTVKGKRFLFKVESSNETADYLKYEELREKIWGFPEDKLPGSRNMLCENFLYDGSSLFIGVYAVDASGRIVEDKAHLIGFSYGFVGVKDKTICFKSLDNLWFYSQYTGVLPEFQGFGLGVLIKEYQKEILLDVFGVAAVTCTYDPLTGVNAFRNIHHFGMSVLEYRTATYGEYGGFLNRLDIPTDRFFMIWDLKQGIERPGYPFKDMLDGQHSLIEFEEMKVAGRTRPLTLEVATGLCLDLDSEFLLVPIPRDFYLMLRETDVSDPQVRRLPVEWRLKSREAFQALFRRGYRIIDFRAVKRRGSRNENYYILKKN